jgi:thiamine pyrophosphate-dependent acetolactate synthase large subunit-like protein
MRNEQAASYAAGAVGFLTGRPGSCITVTGPGVIHGLAGLANAQQNCWPMLLIGGASETYRNGMGSFQEERQVLCATPVSKWAHAIEHVNRIPFYVEMAVRQSIYGRPGATYLDFPDDLITGSCDTADVAEVQKCPDPPRTMAMPGDIEHALDVLQSAQRPLVLIGQGMASSRAEDEVRKFIERTQIPFVRTPKAKGVLPDDHPLSAGAARSLALSQADVVFLMGARFNWILHFGLPPRYAKDVRVVQLDINPESMHQNKPAEVALVGDGKAIVGQLNAGAGRPPMVPPGGLAVAPGAHQEVGRERGDDRAADLRRLVAGRLLPAVQRHPRMDAEGRDPLQRGRHDDGYRRDPAAEQPAPCLHERRQLRHDGRRARDRRRRLLSCIPTARSSTSPATRRSASPAWRWRPSAATACRPRSSSSTMAASARACRKSRPTRCSTCGRTR